MTNATLALTDDLLPAERDQLAAHEATIERGLGTFVEVGNALLAIRDGRLYQKVLGFSTFEDYCRERWGFSRQRAHQMLDAARIVERVSTIVDTLPATESQVRPLAALPAEQQPQAWARAVETATNGKLTAAHVQSVVNEVVAEEAARVEARQARTEAHRAGREALSALADELELAPVDEDEVRRQTALLYPFFDAVHLLAKLPPPAEVIAAMEPYQHYHLSDLPAALTWLADFVRAWENNG